MIFGYIKFDSFYRIPIDILINVFENTSYTFEPEIAKFILKKLGKMIARDPDFICDDIIQTVDGQEMSIYIESLCTSKYVTKEFEIDVPLIPYDYTYQLRTAMVERFNVRSEYKVKLEGITHLYKMLKLNENEASKVDHQKRLIEINRDIRSCFIDYVDSYTKIKEKHIIENKDMDRIIETLSNKMRQVPQSKYMCEQLCDTLFKYQDAERDLKEELVNHRRVRAKLIRMITEKRNSKSRGTQGITKINDARQKQREREKKLLDDLRETKSIYYERNQRIKKQRIDTIRYKTREDTVQMIDYLESLVREKEDKIRRDQEPRIEVDIIKPTYKPVLIKPKKIKNIFDALSTQNYDEVKKFVDENPKSINEHSDGKITPLIFSVKNDLSVNIIELLLISGADVNAQDYGGWSALHYAQKCCSNDVIELLVKHDASYTLKNGEGLTPRDLAGNRLDAQGESIECIENRDQHGLYQILKEWNSIVNASIKDGTTLIHVAAMVGSNPCIETLIRFGADIDHQDSRGMSALHYAVQKNFESTVSLLLRLGADPSLRNKNGKTCFELEGASALMDRYDEKYAKFREMERTSGAGDRKEG